MVLGSWGTRYVAAQGKIYEATSTTYTSIKWKGKTALIVGSSMLAGINERTFVNCKNLKVPGFNIYDMQCKIT